MLRFVSQPSGRGDFAGSGPDGRVTNFESLRAAHASRRQSRTLVIQTAKNTAVISGRDIVITWHCTGYCRAESESAIEFSLDSDKDLPFENTACFAYDLSHDPQQQHRIRPALIGPDGLSKKVSIPFLKPLSRNEPFSVLLSWSMADCMKVGIDYYTTTFSFDQERLPRSITELVFLKDGPEWLDVYGNDGTGPMRKIKALTPAARTRDRTEYREVIRNASANSGRIYLFDRAQVSLSKAPGGSRAGRQHVTSLCRSAAEGGATGGSDGMGKERLK